MYSHAIIPVPHPCTNKDLSCTFPPSCEMILFLKFPRKSSHKEHFCTSVYISIKFVRKSSHKEPFCTRVRIPFTCVQESSLQILSKHAGNIFNCENTAGNYLQGTFLRFVFFYSHVTDMYFAEMGHVFTEALVIGTFLSSLQMILF